ncbi:hypothetical protein ABXJ56_03395 [Microbacterium chocolatum]|uniref:hypothetical protein n=1 Tax=Microbacterium aurantiacum TaxID=162393 RepID=UPI00338FD0E5
MASTVVAEGFTDIVALAHSPSRNIVVVAERSGRLTLLDLLREVDGMYESREIGAGYVEPTHLAIDSAKGRIVVADRDGLWLARLNRADRADATAFAAQPGAVRALLVLTDPAVPQGLAVLDALPAPRLVRYNLDPSPGTTVVDLLPSLPGALEAVPAGAGAVIHVLAATPAGTIVQRSDLTTATVTQVTPAPLPFAGRIVSLTPDWALITGPAGELAAVSDGVTRVIPNISSEPVTAATVVDGRVLLAAGSQVVATALPIGIADPVLLTLDPAPLFVGGYAPVRVDTTGSGVTFDDLELSVDDADLGAVSPSRDDSFDASAPHLLLTGGWRTGTGVVTAKRVGTGEVMGRASFEVTDVWQNDRLGPSFSVTGRCDAPIVRPAWGGGGSGPQNIDVYKAPAAWRMGIVLIDTTSNLYPTAAADIGAIRDGWRDAMIGGVTVGGVTRSVASYFAEVSYGKMTMSLAGNAVAGPVHAAQDWNTYFEVETEPDPANPGSTRPRRWNPRPDAWKALVSALEQANAAETGAQPARPPILDLSQVDALAFVVRTVNRPDPAVTPATAESIGRFVWPQQSTQTVKLNGSDRTLPMMMMPEDWTAIDGRQVYETLAHEIGHSLQLPDLYLYPWHNQGLANRQLRDWDLMHRDRNVPHLSLAMRMALGWVTKDQLKCYNFAANGGAPVLETVRLHALAATTVPGGSFRGVEVRIADGRNYYFEYRNRQGVSIGDGSLPMSQVVMGVDVVSPKGGQNYDSRPMALRLYDDPDAVDDTDSVLTEGAFLEAGDDYREKDFSEGAPKDFVARVLTTTPDSAELQIRYDSEARPELSIRTWPNGDKQWQSPDIEVRNAKSDADPRWLNVPWAGSPNRVVAKVRNRGGVEARDVRASFSIKNLTTNADDRPAAALEPLGLSAPVTIPAGQVRELEVPWVAPTSGHYCITVDIPLYEDPSDPAIHESSDRDNLAQSNYDKFWSESASPSQRKRFTIKLENPTEAPAIVYPRVRQTTPFYRTYLEHSWVLLPPLQSREIGVMTESLDGDPVWQEFIDERRSEMWEVTNILEISGWVSGVCAPQCTGGASLETNSGRRTAFKGIEFFQEPGAAGLVMKPDGTPADHGTVVMTARWEDEDVSAQRTATTEVRSDGRFFAYMQELEPGMVVTLHYLGGYGLAPCDSEPLRADF